jgi:hypothetical protein
MLLFKIHTPAYSALALLPTYDGYTQYVWFHMAGFAYHILHVEQLIPTNSLWILCELQWNVDDKSFSCKLSGLTSP